MPKNYLFTYMAMICLFIITIVKLPTKNIEASNILLFQASIIILGIIVICFKIKPVRILNNKWIALFILMSFFASIFSIHNKSFKLFTYNPSFINILYGLGWYILIIMYLNDLNLGIILDALCIIALLNIGLMIMQKYYFDPIFYTKDLLKHNREVLGFTLNKNEISSLLAVCFPAFMRKKWFVFIPLIIFGLILSQSFLGILSISIICLFYLSLIHFKIFIIGGIGILTGLCIFYTKVDMPTILPRWKLWQIMLPVWRDNWLVGSGLGYWEIIMQRLYEFNSKLFEQIKSIEGKVWWKTAHNEIYQGAFEMGIGFIIIFIGYLWNIIKRVHRQSFIYILGGMSVLICSTGHFTLHVTSTAIISLTWLALLEISLQNNYEQRKA